jgi:predicted GIY-YIG superfamily endonuclease
MKYVYILSSQEAEHFCVGVTDDLKARLKKYNSAKFPILRNIGLGL